MEKRNELDLIVEFEDRIEKSIHDSEKIGYNPTKFKQMVNNKGALATVKQLIVTQNFQYGFKKLKELRRLDLSIEYIVANEDKYASLFTADEIEAAAWNLEQAELH
ncbi:MAG: hypothetical protein ACFWTP_02865 [Enterococcus gilvus]|jgi:hypothetical protein|uniref:hypothetical protein n=1 Tax=Enterococcus gilvus TaxID=160453 RepID=UPI0039F4BAFE